MNITNCTYSLYVSLTWHFHHTAVASVAVYCRDAGPVFTRCHISGTVPARHCSTCSYAQVCHNLNQLIVVTLSRALLRDAVVTCHVSRPGWVTLATALLTTGHEVMMMIHKYALLSGYLIHFLVSWIFWTLTFFAHDKVASRAVQCGVWPGPGCSAGPLNGTCESNVDWEESWNFVTLQISIPRILDGYQCRCHQHPATMHHQSQSPHLTLKYRAFQSHTARDDEMKTSGAKVSLFQILFPADHLIIITNYRLPWKWNWMSLAHNNTLLGI